MGLLKIEQNNDDTTTINGTIYSNSLFEEFGCDFPDIVGQILLVEKKEDGIVTITRLFDKEK